jgi:hypothetical protein
MERIGRIYLQRTQREKSLYRSQINKTADGELDRMRKEAVVVCCSTSLEGLGIKSKTMDSLTVCRHSNCEIPNAKQEGLGALLLHDFQ